MNGISHSESLSESIALFGCFLALRPNRHLGKGFSLLYLLQKKNAESANYIVAVGLV